MPTPHCGPQSYSVFTSNIASNDRNGEVARDVLKEAWKPAQSLSQVTVMESFKTFKNVKVGSINEPEIEANGRKTASGDKTITNSYFPNILIMGSDWSELRIIWGRKLNTPQAETKIFLCLKINIQF